MTIGQLFFKIALLSYVILLSKSSPVNRIKIALKIAAENGYAELLKALLIIIKSLPANIETNYHDALSIAALSKRLETIQALVDKDFAAYIKKASSPLAAKNGRREIFKTLFSSFIESSFIFAAKNNYMKIVKALVSTSLSAKIIKTALRQAANLDKQRQSNFFLGNNLSDNFIKIAFLIAAKYGHTDTVKVFLGNSLPADITRIALQLAAKYGHIKTVEAIVCDDLSVDYKNSLRLALKVAAKYGHTKLVKILLNKSAPSDIKENYYHALLTTALAGQNVTVINLDEEPPYILD